MKALFYQYHFSITTYRNTKTGEVSKEKKEGPDIVQDVTVQVSSAGMDVLQKVFNSENKKPKP